jgi:hypothetical protein
MDQLAPSHAINLPELGVVAMGGSLSSVNHTLLSLEPPSPPTAVRPTRRSSSQAVHMAVSEASDTWLWSVGSGYGSGSGSRIKSGASIASSGPAGTPDLSGLDSAEEFTMAEKRTHTGSALGLTPDEDMQHEPFSDGGLSGGVVGGFVPDDFTSPGSPGSAEGREPLPSSVSPELLGRRRYPCLFAGCSMVLTRPSHLEKHMRVHTNERPHPCTICDMAFKTKWTLTKHIRTHTGEKPFSCAFLSPFRRNTPTLLRRDPTN